MIPFYRPYKLPEADKDKLIHHIYAIVTSRMITNGESCRQLEDQIKRLYSVDHVIACSSCTQGIQMALWTLHKPSNPLLLPAFTWKSVDYITQGYERYWLDIDRETWLPQPANPTWRVNTYLIQHTFGSVLEWEKQGTNNKVIFDAAYSLGAEIKDFGDATLMSMTATKNVTACEAGLVLTNDEKIAGKISEFRDKCSRLSEVNAAVGLAYLKHLDEILERKKKIFEYYRRHLPYPYQKIPNNTTYGYYGMLISTRERDALIKRLTSKLETRIRYEPLIRGLRNTDFVADRILCIPCFPDVNEKEVVELILEATQ